MGKNKAADFKEIEREWYERLKKEGFEDIEYSGSPSKPLKQYASYYFIARTDPLSFESKQNYYQRASQFLHDYLFHSDQEKKIWELHCEGKTLRQIAQSIETMNKDTVRKVILGLKETMFLYHEDEEDFDD